MLQTTLHVIFVFIKMPMTCFTDTRFSIKWFWYKLMVNIWYFPCLNNLTLRWCKLSCNNSLYIMETKIYLLCMWTSTRNNKPRSLLKSHPQSSTNLTKFFWRSLTQKVIKVIWKLVKKSIKTFPYFSTITFFVFHDITVHTWS